MPSLTNPAISRGSIAHTVQPNFNTGDGLQLRPWRPIDATAVAKVYQDPQVRRWHSRTIEDPAEAKSLIERWLRGWQDETGAAWAVVDDGDHLVGRMALTGLDLHEGTGDLAYWTHRRRAGAGWLLEQSDESRTGRPTLASIASSSSIRRATPRRAALPTRQDFNPKASSPQQCGTKTAGTTCTYTHSS